MIVSLLGAETGSLPAFDVNNFINAISNSINNIFGQKDTTAEEKAQQLQAVQQTYTAQLAQVARQNQTTILTIGGIVAVSLVAFTLFKKK